MNILYLFLFLINVLPLIIYCDPNFEQNMSQQNKVKIEIPIERNIINIGEYNLLPEFLSVIEENSSYQIILTQGRIDYSKHSNFDNKESLNYSKNFESKSLKDININLFNNPYGTVFLIKSDNFDFSSVQTVLEFLALEFKIVKNKLLDRTNLIQLSKNQFIISEHEDKPCSEHLDAIFDKFSKEYSSKVLKRRINIENFLNSDYKKISINIENISNEFYALTFEITYKVDNQLEFDETRKNKYIDLNLNNKILKLPFKTKRKLISENGTFNNFRLVNVIQTNLKNLNFKLIEVIPETLTPLLSTILIKVNINNEIFFKYNKNNLNSVITLKVLNKKEEQTPILHYSYSTKSSKELQFELTEDFRNGLLTLINYNNTKKEGEGETIILEFSYELRKNILIFENYQNNMEFGYKLNSGVVMLKDNNFLYLTDIVYYNLKNVDETMPFSIIALSWVLFGFIFKKFLNLFLGKSILNLIP